MRWSEPFWTARSCTSARRCRGRAAPYPTATASRWVPSGRSQRRPRAITAPATVPAWLGVTWFGAHAPRQVGVEWARAAGGVRLTLALGDAPAFVKVATHGPHGVESVAHNHAHDYNYVCPQ